MYFNILIILQSENVVNNWRCDIGKVGYRSVRDLIKSSTLPVEGRQAFVLDELEDLNYIYKHPEREVSPYYSCSHWQMLNLTLVKVSRGAFRSALVSRVFSTHLRKVSSVTNDYGFQIGAIALSAAAVGQPARSSWVHD